jgi:hypothetical protein
MTPRKATSVRRRQGLEVPSAKDKDPPHGKETALKLEILV